MTENGSTQFFLRNSLWPSDTLSVPTLVITHFLTGAKILFQRKTSRMRVLQSETVAQDRGQLRPSQSLLQYRHYQIDNGVAFSIRIKTTIF